MVQALTLLQLPWQLQSLLGHVGAELRMRMLLAQAWQLAAAGWVAYCSSCSAGEHQVRWVVGRLCGGDVINVRDTACC
jgi:hypothetical protein